MDKPGILTDTELDGAVQLLMEVARPSHRPDLLSRLVPLWAQYSALGNGQPDDIWIRRSLCQLNTLAYEHPQESSLADLLARASSMAERNSATQRELNGLSAQVRDRQAPAPRYVSRAETSRVGGVFDGSVGVSYGPTTIHHSTHHYYDQPPSIVSNSPELEEGLERLLNQFIADVPVLQPSACGSEFDSLSAELETRFPGVFLLQGAPSIGKTALTAAIARQKRAAGWKVLALRADVRLQDATTPRGLAQCVGLPNDGIDRFREHAQIANSLMIVDQLDAFAGRRNTSSVVDLLHELALSASRFDRLRILFVGREEELATAADILKLTDPALGAHVLRVGEDLERLLIQRAGTSLS